MEALASWRTYSSVSKNKNWKQFNTIWEELISKTEKKNKQLELYVSEIMQSSAFESIDSFELLLATRILLI